MNDPVRDFWMYFQNDFVWDLLPTPFLYDLFVSWFKRVNPGGKTISQTLFTQSLRQVLDGSDDWEFTDPSRNIYVAQRMDSPEHLIAEYDLERWKNAHYKVTGKCDIDRVCTPITKPRYRGVLRK